MKVFYKKVIFFCSPKKAPLSVPVWATGRQCFGKNFWQNRVFCFVARQYV